MGMLLCHAAQRMGIHTTVLTNDPSGPAVHAADEVVVAHLDDPKAVATLIQQTDVITFELEAVPDVTLDSLREAARFGRLY